MVKLFYIHSDRNNPKKKKVWFRWKIGKMTISRIGCSQVGTDDLRYPFEIHWNGIKILAIGRYV